MKAITTAAILLLSQFALAKDISFDCVTSSDGEELNWQLDANTDNLKGTLSLVGDARIMDLDITLTRDHLYGNSYSAILRKDEQYVQIDRSSLKANIYDDWGKCELVERSADRAF